MTRCFVEKRDGTQNLPATHFEENGDFFYVYDGKKLVGAFDKGIIESIVMAEKREDKEK